MAKKRDYVDKGELIRLEKMIEQEREARRIAEKALRVAQKDLEKRVLERTLELEKANKTLQAEIAERRRVEEALKESEEKNRTLVEYSFDYICETSADGRFLYVNPKHKDLLDYQPDELQGKSIFEFIHPDDRSVVISEFQRAIATFSSGHAIFRFRHKNGQWNWLESTGRPFLTAAGEIRGIIASRDITERKRAEEALRATEEEYRNLFENVPTGVYRTTPDGRILMANPALIKMLGFSSLKEMVSRNLEQEGFEDKNARSRFKALLEREGKVVGLESAWLKNDGSVIFVRESARAVRGKDNTVLYYEGTVEDITERKRAEEALEQKLHQLAKKSRYETIISTVTRSVHRSINLQDVLENAVDSMSQNIDKADIVGIYLVEGKEAVLKAHRGLTGSYLERAGRIPYPKGLTWKTILEAQPVYCDDVENDRFMGPAGKELGIKSYLSMPIRFEGQTVGMMGINSFEKNAFDQEELKLLDIVVQQIEVAINNAKQAGALRQSEERYRTLFDQSPIGVCIIDRDFKITQCNNHLVQIFRSTYDKIIGLDLRKLKDQSFVPIVEKAFEGELGHHETLYETTTSSAQLWLSARAVPLRDSDGNVTGVMGVVEDITERKNMEEEIIKAHKLESLGVLAGGIAHDFNNLLAVILGNVSLTKMHTNLDYRAHKRLTDAEKACLRARDLTQRLITFSRGGAPVKKETVLGELIRESAEFALKGSKTGCDYSIPKDLWAVEVDEGQVSQVIHNLVINAKEAMLDGGIIKITVENVVGDSPLYLPYNYGDSLRMKDGKYIKITVEDNGTGITKEHLPKIFDPYFTTKQNGSGLGLATAYSIIKNHGGYLGVESEIGVGSKFYVYLPVAQGKSSKSKSSEIRSNGGIGKVLVMDDERLVRELAGEILNHLTYETEFASDGHEAIEAYKRAKENGRPFDVVIMDLTVPGGMGGREAIKRMLEFDPSVKAIVSSGYSNDPVISDYKKFGFKGVICKPYKMEDLTEALNRVLHEDD